MPLFEHETPETILGRILGRMDTDLQTREGSYAWDQAAPIAFEIWRVLMTLDELIEAFYVNPQSGPYLDAHADLFAMARRQGTKAAARVTFTGRDGVVVPADTAFFAGELEFRLAEDAVIRDGSAAGWLRAGSVGQKYNVPAGAVSQILRTIPGLGGFEAGAAEGGADPEGDADLYQRLDEKRKRPPTSGNAAHYREWALSVDGVGVVRVTPLWKGPGTVRVLIAGYDRRPVDGAVVDACARYIEERRPVGADVTVDSARAAAVDVSAQVVLAAGASLAAVEAAFVSELDTYLAGLAFEEFTVHANRVGALLLSIDGVVDYSGLTLNGGAGNLELEDDEVPVTGTVTLT